MSAILESLREMLTKEYFDDRFPQDIKAQREFGYPRLEAITAMAQRLGITQTQVKGLLRILEWNEEHDDMVALLSRAYEITSTQENITKETLAREKNKASKVAQVGQAVDRKIKAEQAAANDRNARMHERVSAEVDKLIAEEDRVCQLIREQIVKSCGDDLPKFGHVFKKVDEIQTRKKKKLPKLRRELQRKIEQMNAEAEEKRQAKNARTKPARLVD